MMALDSPVGTVRLTMSEARRLVGAFLEPASGASLAARALVESEVMGEPKFGVALLSTFDHPGRQPRIERLGPSRSRVDASGVFGPVAVASAVEHCAELAVATGLALTTVSQLGGLGRLATYADWGAEQGFISIILVDSPPAVAPPGGWTPVLGTNPIAFGIPASSAVVADYSTSEQTEAGALNAGRTGALQPRGGLIGTLTGLLVEALTGAVEGRTPDRGGRTATVILIEPRDPVSTEGVVGSLELAFHEAGARLPGERRGRQLDDQMYVEMADTLHRALIDREGHRPDKGNGSQPRGAAQP